MSKTEELGIGPWELVANSWQYTTIYDANRRTVCRFDLESWDVTEDNQEELEKRQAEVAQLVLAAPDLLEALKDARYALYGNGAGNPKIDAAIAKAEGASS